jgi:hypothetical protein
VGRQPGIIHIIRGIRGLLRRSGESGGFADSTVKRFNDSQTFRVTSREIPDSTPVNGQKGLPKNEESKKATTTKGN